jgi:hypothetical protein
LETDAIVKIRYRRGKFIYLTPREPEIGDRIIRQANGRQVLITSTGLKVEDQSVSQGDNKRAFMTQHQVTTMGARDNADMCATAALEMLNIPPDATTVWESKLVPGNFMYGHVPTHTKEMPTTDIVRSYYGRLTTDPSQSWYQRWAVPILQDIDKHVLSPIDLVALQQERVESQVLTFVGLSYDMINCIIALYATRYNRQVYLLFEGLASHNQFKHAMGKIGFSPNAFPAGLWRNESTYPADIGDQDMVFILGHRRYLLADWDIDDEFVCLKPTTKVVYFSC